MAYANLIVETRDHVGLVKLNRPDALNALNHDLLKELGEALAKFDADDKIRCIVLTGSAKAFAAGADIKEMSDKTAPEMFKLDFFAEGSRGIERTRTPIIAAVAGYALGGGCELAMMCDFILAADTAKFGQPEINLGVIPGMGGTQRLTHAVGKAKAMEMCLSGRFMTAEEAERSGLVSRVIAADKLLDEALSVAAKIADKSPIATMAAKEAVNRAFETNLTEGVMFERRLFHGLFASEDQKEGMAAFIEKREPQFRGR
ncbi:enoyl-CoA hydratase [uncultured Albimonas sp.]|uniref:enoyl-CoA hydratase n=1 Tax=uncultured Albimonas sp. TaxID=1331701 RepID=UPI0030EB1436|tara:strand:+ start:2551 stop:3327 length:777 start_codon:yes stop_codon:yes gene_type:complete